MFPVILRREIIFVLAVKAALLAILYIFFFSPSHRAPMAENHILEAR